MRAISSSVSVLLSRRVYAGGGVIGRSDDDDDDDAEWRERPSSAARILPSMEFGRVVYLGGASSSS